MRGLGCVSLVVVVAVGGTGVLAATGGLHVASEALPAVDPFIPAQATATEQRPRAADASLAASPSARPGVAASPWVASSEIVAVASRADQKMTLVEPATRKAPRSFDLGMTPVDMTLAPGGQSAWVFSNKPGETDFTTVDLVKGERKDAKRLHDNPRAAAFSSDGSRAYVSLIGANESPPYPTTIAFVTPDTAEEFGHIELGTQSPGVAMRRQVVALAVVQGQGREVLYAAGQASGTVWALDAGSGKLLQQIEVGGGPIAVLPDPARQRLYILADTINQVVAVDTATPSIVSRLDLPGRPTSGAIASDGGLYITGGDAGQLWPVNAAMTEVGQPIAVGSQPASVGVSRDGTRVYVANRGDDSLAVVDAHTHQVTTRIPVGKEPVAVLVAPGQPAAGSVPSPTPRPTAHPTATPTIVPTPTALLEGAAPPEHLPPGVVSETFVPGAEFPATFTFAPDGRLFYNELHTGRIRVVQNGALLPQPFFQFTVAGEPETGLIGLTLDPNFATNHYVYVFYTSVPEGTENGGTNGPNQLVRLTDVANIGTNLTYILRDLPSGPIHNSGTMHFGADGKLYVSIGDNDQGNNAQDLGALAGKILRVNPDGSIPDDNPFVNQDGKQPAIWAYGLRNPFSFDFDPVSHGLLATENGPGDNDELDMIYKGANYGWPPSGYKYRAGVTDPIAVINPPISPTGNAFYTSDQVPDWKNDWFYCNYHQAQLRRVRLAPISRDRVVFEEVVKSGCSLDVATGPDGALYYSNAKGIYRIRSTTAANLLPPVTVASVAAQQATADAAGTPQGVLTATVETLPAGTRAEDRDVNISMSEWKLQPSRTRVPAGEIRFLSENTGLIQHALRIVGHGLDVSTNTFGPGQSRTVSVRLPAGEYQLICPLPGHQQQGMAAKLSVVGP